MSVIPLTLAISLCLVFTFIVFFLREQSRSRLSSPERDSMLPFSPEKGTEREDAPVEISFKSHAPGQHRKHRHEHGAGGCESGKPEHERCHDCPSRGPGC